MIVQICTEIKENKLRPVLTECNWALVWSHLVTCQSSHGKLLLFFLKSLKYQLFTSTASMCSSDSESIPYYHAHSGGIHRTFQRKRHVLPICQFQPKR